MIFFQPPEALTAIVRERELAAAAERGGGGGGGPAFRLPDSQLFVKRVAGVAGDEYSVDTVGRVRVAGQNRWV